MFSNQKSYTQFLQRELIMRIDSKITQLKAVASNDKVSRFEQLKNELRDNVVEPLRKVFLDTHQDYKQYYYKTDADTPYLGAIYFMQSIPKEAQLEQFKQESREKCRSKPSVLIAKHQGYYYFYLFDPEHEIFNKKKIQIMDDSNSISSLFNAFEKKIVTPNILCISEQLHNDDSNEALVALEKEVQKQTGKSWYACLPNV